jgi:hypothetical protein
MTTALKLVKSIRRHMRRANGPCPRGRDYIERLRVERLAQRLIDRLHERVDGCVVRFYEHHDGYFVFALLHRGSAVAQWSADRNGQERPETLEV